MSARVRKIGIGIAFGALVSMAAVAVAQPPGGRGGLRGRTIAGGMGGLGLLRMEQVQKELSLSEQQKTKLQELAEKTREEARERFSGARDLSQEERRKRFEDMREEMQERAEKLQKQITEILKPEQVKRLRQIELQQQGPAALMRPVVAETVGLTDEQKEKLQQIASDTREKMRGIFEEMRGGDRERRGERGGEVREKMQQIRQEGEKEAMAILKPEQKQKLGEMMGEPFELDRSQFAPRRGRGGDRQRGDRDRPRRPRQRVR